MIVLYVADGIIILTTSLPTLYKGQSCHSNILRDKYLPSKEAIGGKERKVKGGAEKPKNFMQGKMSVTNSCKENLRLSARDVGDHSL